MKILVLFTDFFPYGNTETFLEAEIEFLSQGFERVIICPRKVADKKRTVPPNVIVTDIFGRSRHVGKSGLYFEGLCFIFLNLGKLLKLSYFAHFGKPGFVKAIKYTGLASSIKRDIDCFLKENNFDFSITLFYTYWLGYETFALGLIKQQNRLLKLISRAHGIDLYDERGERSLTFIKAVNLKLTDRVYCISEHGKKYLIERYPHAKGKLFLSYLGTKNPGFVVEPKTGDTFRIVSCSGLRPVKRLDKVIDVLFHLASLNPPVNIEWHHIGDGPLRDETIALAEEKLKGKIEFHFYGDIENRAVFEYYKKIQPSLFINLSDSEGLPVSIMEAMSAGIPVVATDVGGTSEIVNDGAGWLVNLDESSELISRTIKNNLIGGVYAIYGKAAFLKWQTCFDAELNYKKFTNLLLKNEFRD